MVRGALENSGMDSGQVDLVLQALNTMQDRLKDDFTKKLEDFVSHTTFRELETEMKVLNQRLTTNDKMVEETALVGLENSERLENNRKRLQRLIGEFEALKRKTASSMAMQKE